MRTLAALLAAVSMTGCVMHIPPGRDDVDEHRRGGRTIVICVFANCRDIFKPEKQKTPAPAPSSSSRENARTPQASRLDPPRAGAGVRP